jgi:hypothetical protein
MATYQSTNSPDLFAVSPAINAALGFAIITMAGIVVTAFAIVRLPGLTVGLIAGPAIVVAAAASAWREREMFGR